MTIVNQMKLIVPEFKSKYSKYEELDINNICINYFLKDSLISVSLLSLQ